MQIGAWLFWGVLIIAAGLRIIVDSTNSFPDVSACTKSFVSGSGVITTEPERKDSGQAFTVRSSEVFLPNGNVCGTDMLIRMKTKLHPRFVYDEKIAFAGKISQPRNFKNDDGRSFDYVNYLAKEDIYLEIKSAQVSKGDIQIIATTSLERNTLTSSLYSIKRKFVGSLEKSLGDPHASLAAGLVVGEKSTLGKDLLDDFRKVGLIHIIVLSGYNITIIADALRKVLGFLPRTSSIVVGCIGIVAFGLMVGGGATVVRSCLMASVALFGELIRRDYDVRRALAFAALIMLIENPRILLHDPSFQLSFLATLGLIAFAGPFEKKLTFVTEKLGMRSIVASTIATQIFVSPFILYLMGELSIIGMVVNLLVLPFIPFTMLIIAITGLSGMIFAPIAEVFSWLAHILLSYELFIVERFASLSFASIHVPKFSGIIVIAFYIALIVYFFMKKGFSNSVPQLPNSHFQ